MESNLTKPASAIPETDEILALRQTILALQGQLNQANHEIQTLKADRDRLSEERTQMGWDSDSEPAHSVSEARLEIVLKHLPIGVWFSNAQGTLIYGNPAGQHIWEGARYVGPDQFYEYKAWWYESGEEIQPNDWAVARAIRKQETSLNELIEIQCFDGSHKIIRNSAVPMLDENGKLLGAVVLNEDISEKLMAEQQLKESEKRYRTLVESLHEGVWLVDAQGRTLYVNEQMASMLGYTRSEMEGREFFDFMDADAAEEAQKEFEQRKLGKPGLMERELLKKDGSVLYGLFAAQPLFSEDGAFSGSLSGVLDISSRKQAEATLLAYADKLAVSNRELEQFAFIASHDLQEPLRKIETFGTILMDHTEGKLVSVDQDYLERMVKAARRMRNMVNALLALSQITTHGISFTQVDLNEVISTVLDDLEVSLQKTGGRVEIKNALPAVEADISQMHQLFQNLIGNSIKFNRPEAAPHVIISAQRLPPPRRLTKTSPLLNTDIVEITIEDNGIGFDPKMGEHLFKPFVRLHGRAEYEGSGIGLTICRKIIDRHGGSIQFDSTPGVGTRFVIRLRAG